MLSFTHKTFVEIKGVKEARANCVLAKIGKLVALEQGVKKGELVMMNKEELHKLQEEQEVMETWRKVSRHVVADLLEGCSVCSTIRERDLLLRCPWCNDVYLCPGECMHQHNLHLHPTVSFWSR